MCEYHLFSVTAKTYTWFDCMCEYHLFSVTAKTFTWFDCMCEYHLFSVTAKTFTWFDCMCEYHGRFVTTVPPWVTLVEQELLSFCENLSPPLFFGGVRVLYVVLLCVFMFCVPWCDVRYDIHIITMFGSSLPLVVCGRIQVLLRLYVFACV
jgi:hypothetical protein